MTSAHPTPPEVSIGGYRLLARIGEGGMGVVHVAQAPDGDRVALKVLRPHVVGDAEGRERLAREVASLRKVRSRHVAEILGADPQGDRPFIVTRYVPGLSLHDTVRTQGPLSPRDLAHAARHLLEAVRDVHAADVLHRDIKPTNVVMEGRSPILIDFGLARLAEDPRLTATGWLLGSPGYLAPEVLFGDEATAATDVHGWAATMVHAATGRSPYGRGHTMTLLDRTRRGDIDLRGVLDPLRRLLAQCLALEPLDRPSVREVGAELDSLDADHLPTQAVAVAPPVGPADVEPGPTRPWQLADDEPRGPDSTTELLGAPPVPAAGPPTAALPPVPAPPQTITSPPRSLATVPTLQQWPKHQPPTALRPVPQLAPLPRAGQQPLTRSGRLRRALLLVSAWALVVAGFRAAPYLTVAAVALLVVATRGVSRSQDALRRRRLGRGPRWHDAPRTVLGYPWHVARGAGGAVVLLVCAVGLAVAVSATAIVFGAPTPDALVAGGLTLGLATWHGPASGRVRWPLGRAATAAAHRPAVTAGVSLVLLLGVAAAWSASVRAPAGRELTDWRQWHQEYDDPASGLSRRRRLVQQRVAACLDRTPGAGPVGSACAGAGRDLLDVLAARPDDARRVTARLVELDPALADLARERAAQYAPGVGVVVGDAGDTDSYAGAVPADLVMLCGVFGNITDDDIRRTVAAVPTLMSPGAVVVWTRGSFETDMAPTIASWFEESGFERTAYHADDEHRHRVVEHRLVADPQPFRPGQQLFTFVR